MFVIQNILGVDIDTNPANINWYEKSIKLLLTYGIIRDKLTELSNRSTNCLELVDNSKRVKYKLSGKFGCNNK